MVSLTPRPFYPPERTGTNWIEGWVNDDTTDDDDDVEDDDNNINNNNNSGETGGKEPLGRPRRRWVDNIRMDLQEVGCGYVDWIGLAQDRDRWRKLVSAVMNLLVP